MFKVSFSSVLVLSFLLPWSKLSHGGELFLFGFSKTVPSSPIGMQQYGISAVDSVVGALSARQHAKTLVLKERVRNQTAYLGGDRQELVTPEIIRKQLKAYAATLQSSDTIIIYSHSHGIENQTGKEGGLELAIPVAHPDGSWLLPWSEYASLILDLPAKNVVVLTMSCYSGGLVEALNEPAFAKKIREKFTKRGRSLLVITSTNDQLHSETTLIGGKNQNPFTYAIIQAIAGGADGYLGSRNGWTESQEFARYVLNVTQFTGQNSQYPNHPMVFNNVPQEFEISPVAVLAADLAPVYRLYNGHEHFYTLAAGEGTNVGYQFEFMGFKTFRERHTFPNLIPLYRCYWNAIDAHLVSTSEDCEGLTLEGQYGYISTIPFPGSVPLYRFYNGARDHLITSSFAEGARARYQFEFVLGYVMP